MSHLYSWIFSLYNFFWFWVINLFYSLIIHLQWRRDSVYRCKDLNFYLDKENTYPLTNFVMSFSRLRLGHPKRIRLTSKFNFSKSIRKSQVVVHLRTSPLYTIGNGIKYVLLGCKKSTPVKSKVKVMVWEVLRTNSSIILL